MLRLLLLGLGLLAVLYGAKVVLVQLAVPMEIIVSEDEVASLKLSGNESDADGGAQTQAGQELLRRGKDAEAFSLYSTCVLEANESSQREACRTALGELYVLGAGVPRNLSQATALFQTAADVGDPDAQYNLGILYAAMHQPGDDFQRREALAVLHLYAASTAGHPGALMAMGYRHMQGYGVPQSCSTAALNYIDVAKRIVSVYSEGMPQAVQLIRLNLHQKDRKVISNSEMNLFVQIARSGDSTVAAAIGKRFLLGLEGFKQDYHKAKYYLRLAAAQDHPGAMALLGYMYCLGLGTPTNLEKARTYFVSAAMQNDPLGHNGLGFIYFRGDSMQDRNLRLAFHHFNESAYGGSSDGMFNLASMYLTGTGTEQSFQKAVLHYTQALDRGHTPAAYSLAVMHLNGIGTVRDCDIAVNLLKKVCERGGWVSSKLVDAYEYGDKQPDKAALLFLKLAEAGHEVAQMNAAHLFDSGQSSLLYSGPTDEDSSDLQRHHGRTLAQRFYEMSAEQGSASSELRLGDFSYYGWGVSAGFKEHAQETVAIGDSTEDGEPDAEEKGFELPNLYTDSEVELSSQTVDYEASLARYRKTAEMTVTGEWMQSFVARGSFNLGFMHQFGVGVAQDLQTAKQHYHRCREVDPHGLHTPVTMVLMFLGAHMLYLRVPEWPVLLERLFADIRVHLVLLHMVGILMMVLTKVFFARTARTDAADLRAGLAAAAATGAGAPGSASASSVDRPEGQGELRRRHV